MTNVITHLTAKKERSLTGKTLSHRSIAARMTEGEIVRLALKGEIIHAKSSGLTFIYRHRQDRHRIRTQTLFLEGSWYLTEAQQLRFRTKKLGKTLRFEGIWQLNQNHELIYRHERRKLIRSVARFRSLTFKGRWKVKRYRVAYQLEGGKDRFSLIGKIGTLSAALGQGRITLELGAGYRRLLRDPKLSRLVLLGSWKPLSSTELGFVMRIASGRDVTLRIQGKYRWGARGDIEFSLDWRPQGSQPLLTVVLSRRLWGKQSEIFLKGETDFSRKHFLGLGGSLKW